MHLSIRRSALAISIALSIGAASATAVLANDADGDRDDAVAVLQTNLDSNVAGVGNTPDINLTNAWGLAFAVVTIPAPKNSPTGSVSAPTGIVSNPTTVSSPESLFFTAGPNDENNGLFGVINRVARDRDYGR